MEICIWQFHDIAQVVVFHPLESSIHLVSKFVLHSIYFFVKKLTSLINQKLSLYEDQGGGVTIDALSQLLIACFQRLFEAMANLFYVRNVVYVK